MLRLKLFTLAVAWVCFSTRALTANKGWEPSRTWLFAVGILEWQDGAEWPVKSEGSWYAATVLRGWYGLHYVHYDGWAAKWDEWLSADAIKKE